MRQGSIGLFFVVEKGVAVVVVLVWGNPGEKKGCFVSPGGREETIFHSSQAPNCALRNLPIIQSISMTIGNLEGRQRDREQNKAHILLLWRAFQAEMDRDRSAKKKKKKKKPP